MSTFVYIDESGDTGYTKKSSRYFIVTAIYTNNVQHLRKIVVATHRYKKDKKKSNQLHANSETKRVKDKFAKELNKKKVFCMVGVVDKQMIRVDDLYLYLLEKIAAHYSTTGNHNFILAKRDMRKNYNEKIINIFKVYDFQAQILNSYQEKVLQIADFYSWSMFTYLEYGNDEYFLKFKDTILIL